MKKVLIALDYDQNAQKVAETGYSLARIMDANVTLLHVVSEPVYYSSTSYNPIMGFTGQIELDPRQINNVEGLKKASKRFLLKSKHHLGDESIQTVIKEGELANTIVKTAKDMHADLIVMGSHSRKWLDEILLGSVTEEVLHKSTIPLFIIPTKKDN
jgi:nucleotide-binding universal stress UspA family protein